MTNVDPGGLLVLLTVIPAVVAGGFSIGLAHLVAWLGDVSYRRTVWVVLGVLVLAWIVAALVVVGEATMLYVLAVGVAMLGAFVVTRDVSATSYGWVLGVVLLYLGFAVLSWAGLYAGVDRAGRPQGIIARNLLVFYLGGLFAGGMVGGAVVRWVRDRLGA